MTPEAASVALQAEIAYKRREYENYQSYIQVRLKAEDLHAVWDAAVNLSELSNYIDALEWSLALVRKIGVDNEAAISPI